MGPPGPLRHDPLPRPLSPRSVIASLLLGIHPPRLRGALLVRWCGLLGIAEGTTRVALSRMVDAGELTTDAGRYELAGPLRARQAGQDWSLAPVLLPWSGEWDLWVVRPGARDAASRAALRRAAAAARLVERRDGVWGRPDNLPPDATPAEARGCSPHRPSGGPPARTRPRRSTSPPRSRSRTLAERSTRLLDDLVPVTAALAAGDLDQLAPAFALGAAALLQVRRDPLLPPELAGPGWPGPALRAAYVEYQHAFATAAGSWFAAVRSEPAGRGVVARPVVRAGSPTVPPPPPGAFSGTTVRGHGDDGVVPPAGDPLPGPGDRNRSNRAGRDGSHGERRPAPGSFAPPEGPSTRSTSASVQWSTTRDLARHRAAAGRSASSGRGRRAGRPKPSDMAIHLLGDGRRHRANHPSEGRDQPR